MSANRSYHGERIRAVFFVIRSNPALQRAFAAAICGRFSGVFNHHPEHVYFNQEELAGIFESALQDAAETVEKFGAPNPNN